MIFETTIERLESRIAPAVITSPTPEPAPSTEPEVANDPAMIAEEGSAASPTVTQPATSLTSNDLNDLTNLQDLTTVTDLTDVSRAVANLGLAPNAELGTAEASRLANATSPILRDAPAASISPDSVIAVLGLDRVQTTVFPGPVQLLGPTGVGPLFESMGLTSLQP